MSGRDVSLGMLAMAVFAVTGVVAGGKKDMDILTIVILGNVTAIGGGALRDVLLDVNPIYWIADLTSLVSIRKRDIFS